MSKDRFPWIAIILINSENATVNRFANPQSGEITDQQERRVNIIHISFSLVLISRQEQYMRTHRDWRYLPSETHTHTNSLSVRTYD